MREDRHFRRVAGIFGLLMAAFMIGNGATIVAALKDPAAAFNDPTALLSAGASAAGMFHLSMVFDVLAYLSFAPIVVFCWDGLKRPRAGLASLFAFCGLAYSLLGSIGGVVEDAILPEMMTRYASAGTAEQATLRVAAGLVNQAVAHGIWNPLEVLMVSVWFLGFAILVWRQKRGLSVLALIIGAVGLLDPIGWMLGSSLVLTIGALGTAPMPVWVAWFGIDVLRNPRAAAWLAEPEGALE